MSIKKILIIILPLFCISALSYFIYNKAQYEYVINENGFNDKAAMNELYEYLMNENPEIKKLYPEQCSKDTVNAIYYDLDDDKTSEIIGFSNCTTFQGISGVTLYILKKTNDNYKNISYLVNFYFQDGIKILKRKTNSYKDLKITAKYTDKIKSVILKYNGKYYVDNDQIKQLKKLMQHNK